jgi:hypothetical protein
MMRFGKCAARGGSKYFKWRLLGHLHYRILWAEAKIWPEELG